MSVSAEDKLCFFSNELSLIKNSNIREFTSLCITASPDYIYQDCPASSSGKFHHVDELSWDGTIIHTRKVVSVGYDLARGIGVSDQQDEIISSCIIHDLRKQGKTRSGHTQKNHPGLAAELVSEVYYKNKALISDNIHQAIRTACGYHYGPWSIHPWNKPMIEYTPVELAVYLADYVASRKSVVVNYTTREW